MSRNLRIALIAAARLRTKRRDTARERFIRHRPAAPECFEQMIAFDNLAGIGGELFQNLHYLRLDMDLAWRTDQQVPEREGAPNSEPKTNLWIAVHSDTGFGLVPEFYHLSRKQESPV